MTTPETNGFVSKADSKLAGRHQGTESPKRMSIDVNPIPRGIVSLSETQPVDRTPVSDQLLSCSNPEEILEILNHSCNGALRYRAGDLTDIVYSFVKPRMKRGMPCQHFILQNSAGDRLAVIEWNSGSTDEHITRFLENYRGILSLKFENWSLRDRLENQLASSVRALSRTIEAKDRYTGGHTQRVYRYSDRLISGMGLPEVQAEKIRLAGLLHDVGKIGVPDRILLKPASLDEAEWEVMRSHTEMGYSIVSEIAGLEEVAEILKHHHERWDGNGYALGLKGLEIPFESRVIAVADAFDAITTRRPYREASSYEEARRIISELSGTHFDPYMVRQFESVFDGLVEDAALCVKSTFEA